MHKALDAPPWREASMGLNLRTVDNYTENGAQLLLVQGAAAAPIL